MIFILFIFYLQADCLMAHATMRTILLFSLNLLPFAFSNQLDNCQSWSFSTFLVCIFIPRNSSDPFGLHPIFIFLIYI
jgi:hypothetical protein